MPGVDRVNLLVGEWNGPINRDATISGNLRDRLVSLCQKLRKGRGDATLGDG